MNLNTKIMSGELVKDSVIREFAATRFEERWGEDEIALDEEEKAEGRTLKDVQGEAKDKTVELSSLHGRECAPTIFPKATQFPFTINLDGWLRIRGRELHEQADRAESASGRAKGERYPFEVHRLRDQAMACNRMAIDGADLVGTIDIIDAPLGPRLPLSEMSGTALNDGATEEARTLDVVRDTKTSSKSPAKSIRDQIKLGIAPATAILKPGDADDSDQLTAYALGRYIENGKLPDMMVLDYLVQTRGKTPKRYYTPSYTRRTAEDIKVLQNRIISTVHAFYSGVFTPTSPTDWRCSRRWCGYFDICPHSKKPTLISITQDLPQ
jgi:hypothetical protein